ncbi:MAG: TonB-dependent receptor [Pseudomonadota bacterium]
MNTFACWSIFRVSKNGLAHASARPGLSVRLGVLLLVAVLTLPSTGAAQQGDEAARSAGAIEEITVSATRRVESIQDVPVSVSSIGSDTIQKTGVFDVGELSRYLPNFEFSDASILPNLYVRGIGSGTTHSIEQSVGRFIDDVYISRAAVNLHPLLDVSNVEVVRGPQGTLFGKNTIAGAMIINTGDPTSEFDASLNTFGSDFSTTGGAFGAEAFVSSPLSDTVSARVAVLYRTRDGYIRNEAPGPDGGTRDDYGARLKLRWDAGDNTQVDFKLEHTAFDEEGQTPSEVVAGPPVEAFQAFNPAFTFDRDFTSYIDCTAEIEGTTFCPERDQDHTNLTLNIAHQLGEVGELRSISAFQAYDFVHRFVAVDGGVAGGAFRAIRDEDFEGFTQELRFTSEEFAKFDYIVGAFYENSSVTRLQNDDTNVPAFLGGGPPPNTLNEDWSQDTETIAVFGQLRYRFDDRWSAIIGGRYSYEEKDFSFFSRTVAYNGDPNVDPALPGTEELDFNLTRDEDRFTPSFTLRFEPTDDLSLYASISQGHKTGGFSDRPQEDQDFDAELATAYELGIKGTFLAGRLRANLAFYHVDLEDLQVARALPGPTVSFEVQNAAEAVSQGVEVDAVLDLAAGWTLGGNFAYTDATYDDFPGASATCPEVGGFIEGDLCNFEGIPLIFAPEFKGALFVEYESEPIVGDWIFTGRADVSYSSRYYTELSYFESLAQEEYALLNANLSLGSQDGRYTVSLIGKNLTEQHVLAWGLEAGPSRFVTPNAPRELRVQFAMRY